MLERAKLIALFDQLIEQQQNKVLKIAKQCYPQVTPEDIRNPQDFAKLRQHDNFNFEDGILAGFISAKMALLAEYQVAECQAQDVERHVKP